MSLVQVLRQQGFRWKTANGRHPQLTARSAKRVGDLVYVSGQLPVQDDGTIIQGRVGTATDPDGIKEQIKQATDAARLCAAWNLFAAATVVNGPDDIVGVADMTVCVRSTKGFGDLSSVAEGASVLLRQVLSEDGVGAHTEFGVIALPRQAMVQVTVTFIVK